LWLIILTQQQLVAVAPRSLFKLLLIAAGNVRYWLFAIVFSFIALPQIALAQAGDSPNPGGYVARIQKDSPDELAKALARAEKIYMDGQLPQGANPISIILHGPEVEIFFKDKYGEYKKIVDLAARLSAFGVLDVMVCETKTGILGRGRSSIHPFIGIVPLGPAEVKRLLVQQDYVYF